MESHYWNSIHRCDSGHQKRFTATLDFHSSAIWNSSGFNRHYIFDYQRTPYSFKVKVKTWISSVAIPIKLSRCFFYTTDSGTCNRTIDGSREYTGDSSQTAIHPPPVTSAMLGQTIYCSYTFQGARSQRVMINIREMKLGQFDGYKNR